MTAFSNRSLTGIFYLLAGYFSYTAGDVFIKTLSARYGTFEIVCLIGLGFGLAILTIAIQQGRLKTLRAKRPRLLIARGALNSMHSALVFYSFSHMPIVNVYAFLFAAPVFLTLQSVVFLGEEVGWRRWTAVLTGFLGILIMLRPGALVFSWPLLAVMLTPVTSSTGMLLIRLASRTESTLTISLYSAGMNVLIAGIIMAPHFLMPSALDWLMFMIAGGLNAFGMICIIRGFTRTGTPLGAPFQYTQLLWGTLAGWLFWHHLPDFWMYVGALIVGGIGLFTFYRELVRQRHNHLPGENVAEEIIGARKV
jgi:drug/metabolite transporter (DMT)-like permease